MAVPLRFDSSPRLRDVESLTARGRLREVFERKGHEMVSMDLLLVANEKRLVQQVRHTAIYRIRVQQS